MVNNGNNNIINDYWLVVAWTMEFYDFPNVVGMMIQSDFHIFQGVETTNQIMFGFPLWDGWP